DGLAENRRVEISTNMPSLLEPVRTNDTLRTVEPPTLRMKPEYTAEAGVQNWRASITQEGRTLKQVSGAGEVPPSLDWYIDGDLKDVPLGRGPIVSTLELTDRAGKVERSSSEIPVDQITIQRKREERMGDIAFERFNLITFEFDKASVSGQSLKIAREI